MALPTVPTEIFQESPDSVRGRLLDSLPGHLARVEGSWPRDFLEFGVLEFVTVYTRLNRLVSEMFPDWATGERLDAWANAYGLTRSEGTKATGIVRFSGIEGTALTADTLVSVPTTDPDADRAFFRTTNPVTLVIGVDLYVDVPIEALDIGIDFNVGVGEISLLESTVLGLTDLTNPQPVSGGTDPEEDEELRDRILEEARQPIGAGTKLDYMIWGTEIPGVEEVSVLPLWDTSGITPGSGNPNGTVALSIRGPLHQPVAWEILEQTQKHIDPSRQLIALMENGEGWGLEKGAATLGWSSADKQQGSSGMTIAIGAATPHLAAPTGGAGAAATGGLPGLAAATYYYRITAYNEFGETQGGTEFSTVVGGANNKVNLTWSPVTDAAGYRVYRSTVSGSGWLRVGEAVGGAFTDEGAVTPGAAHPGASSAENPPVVGIDRPQDLSRFGPGDDMFIWLKSSDWAMVPNQLELRLETSPGNNYEFNLGAHGPAGTAKPASGNAWWQFIPRKSSAQVNGAPSWSAITRTEIIARSLGAHTLTLDYWRFIGAGGASGEGRAPIGASVTVLTPVPKLINVTATVTLAAGYTLTGAVGTVNAADILREQLNEFLLTVEPGTTVRAKDIENVIHDAAGIIDFAMTVPAANTPIASTEYATLGTLTVT